MAPFTAGDMFNTILAAFTAMALRAWASWIGQRFVPDGFVGNMSLQRVAAAALSPAGVCVAAAGVAVLVARSMGLFHSANRRPIQIDYNGEKQRGLSVVITGGSRGLGWALAREFVACGDKVVIASRSLDRVQDVSLRVISDPRHARVAVVLHMLTTMIPQAAARLRALHPQAAVVAAQCDVGSFEACLELASTALEHHGRIDIWVNAGTPAPCHMCAYDVGPSSRSLAAALAGSVYAPLHSLQDRDVKRATPIVGANVLGAVHGYAAAARVMMAQPGPGGRVFFVDGRGGDGAPTPDGALYGCTKACVKQLFRTTVVESRATKGRVGVHMVQPGMMVTPLLLDKRKPLPARHIKVRSTPRVGGWVWSPP